VNIHLLNRLLQIQSGKELSVPRAKISDCPKTPLQEFGSINILTKIERNTSIYRENLHLAEKLKAIEGTISATELRKQWKETERIKNMVKFSKASHAQLSIDTFKAITRTGSLN